MLHHPVEAYFYRMGRRSDERKEMELVELLHSKNEEPPHLSLSRHEERRTSPHLPRSLPEEWTKNPPWYFFFRPPPPPAPLSYPQVWIFRPIFHLGDRSEDRNRPSILCARNGIQIMYFPGHALHEKGLQRQRGVGPLVSSQEERALLVPVINRG